MNVLFTPSFAPTLHDLAIMLHAIRESPKDANPRNILLTDTLPFSRKSRVHRAQIRANTGAVWIQIPIRTEDKKYPLNEVRISTEPSWVHLLYQTLETAYGGSSYFDEYIPWFMDIFNEAPGSLLLSTTMRLRQKLFEFLHLSEISTHEIFWSEWAQITRGSSSEATLQKPQFQEPKSKNYMPLLATHPDPPFTHPIYRQHFGGFIPGLSLLDLLFEMGPESWKVLDELG